MTRSIVGSQMIKEATDQILAQATLSPDVSSLWSPYVIGFSVYGREDACFNRKDDKTVYTGSGNISQGNPFEMPQKSTVPSLYIKDVVATLDWKEKPQFQNQLLYINWILKKMGIRSYDESPHAEDDSLQFCNPIFATGL
ncbi:unnamed protein product [Dovyalis caffra]|uniref:Uncharacterized protein n=1 Tax=Dovyalis caffra TaxID=77055 RepID=A0AAV1R7S4_9ROSI|nr:unnamed protein product [Dovyalis caffra]